MTKPHIAGTEKAEGERIFRLHDMLVQEVSLVDRAANLKQFLVLKREDDSMQPGKELKPDGNGGFVTEKSEGATTETTEVITEAQKLELGSIATQTKADVLRLVSGTLENLMVLATAIKEADEVDGAETLPTPIVEGLKSIGGIVQGVIERYSAPAPAETVKAEEVVPAETPTEGAAAEPVVVESTPAATEDEVLKALAAAAQVLSPAAPVDKAGRKMSKTRLDKLREAVDALSELLADVGPDALEKRAPGAPAKSPAEPDTRAQEISELTKSVEELTKVAKSSRAEITKLQKSVGLPNSLPVEGGGVTSTPSSGGGDVSWPLDMNAPVSRDTVGKSQWFTSTENN